MEKLKSEIAAEKKRKDPAHQAKKKKAREMGDWHRLVDLHLEEIGNPIEKIIFLLGAYTVHVFMGIAELALVAVGGYDANQKRQK